MSQYLSTEAEEMEQVASNLGWSEFCDWSASLDIDAFPSVQHLSLHGFDNDPDMLLAEMEDAMVGEPAPSDDVRSIAQGLIDFLHDHQDAEIIVIGDGMTSDDEDDEDEGTEEDDADEDLGEGFAE